MALYERIKLWETTVTTGQGPVNTIGYYTSETGARRCKAVHQSSIDKSRLIEIHELNGIKIGEEYFVGSIKAVAVDVTQSSERPKTYEERLAEGYYTCKLPYPGSRDPEAKQKRAAFSERQAQLDAEFRVDLLEHYGVTGHPKAAQAFAIAWDQGHAGGYHDVDCCFAEIVELLK